MTYSDETGRVVGEFSCVSTVTLAWIWAVPGCNDTVADRSGLPESSVTTQGPRRWYHFDLTDLVQAWANGSLDNCGVLLRAASTSTGLFYVGSNEGDVVEQRPRLVVTYR